MAKDSDVPQPGPARLTKGAGPDEWLEQAKQCKYLPEADMKRLCEIVKEYLMEGEDIPMPAYLLLTRIAPEYTQSGDI
jgi:serine/threonine-protein phosphatase PP1-1